MTGLKILLSSSASLALLGGLVGCAPATVSPWRASFLPPPPASPAARAVTPDPPPIDTRLELSAPPHFFTPGALAARPGRAEAVIREADVHYQAGHRHYQDGDQDGARREFDRAIDVLLAAPDEPALRPALDNKLEELVEAIHRLDLAGLGSADIVPEPVFEKPPLEDIPPLTFPYDPKLRHQVIEELRATASQLPLEVNDEVISYINYFSTARGRKILVAGMKRAGRYRSLIQRIFDEEGVPQELIFLAQAESGFLPRAVSRMRATGMWQFMLLRGRQYGLERSAYADDRLDPEKATRAAARHLHDLYNRYGDWYLALAAYNCGPGVIDRGVERTGYADFWQLCRRGMLPRETSRYVPIILAMTIMAKNPREYGLAGIDSDPALEYDTLRISAPTHLQLIADLTETPVSQIRELNPSLLKSVAPLGTSLRVGRGAGDALAAALEKIPPERRTVWRAHRVLDGETLGAIARRYRVAERGIAAANPKLLGGLAAGDLLIIPALASRDQPLVRPAVQRRGSHRVAARAARSPRHRAAARRAAVSSAASLTHIAARRTAASSLKR